MNTKIPLPTLEEIAEMDLARQNAIESLEYNKAHNKVRCQRCQKLQAIPKLNNDDKKKNLLRSTYSRIKTLQSMIETAQTYHPDGNTCKSEKEELQQLLEQERKRDILRRLPLYSSRMTDYKFVCSKCYDEAYIKSRIKSKESILTKTIFTG